MLRVQGAMDMFDQAFNFLALYMLLMGYAQTHNCLRKKQIRHSNNLSIDGKNKLLL